MVRVGIGIAGTGLASAPVISLAKRVSTMLDTANDPRACLVVGAVIRYNGTSPARGAGAGARRRVV